MKPKQKMEGIWKDFGLYQPLSPSEIKSLKENEEERINNQRLWEGRGANITYLGRKAMYAFASCPEEIRMMSKTQRLNFIGEIMEISGLLECSGTWDKTKNKIKNASEITIASTRTEVKNERYKMVEFWIRQALNYECKTADAECQDCECNSTCNKKLYKDLCLTAIK